MTDTDTSDEAAFKYYRNWVGDPEFSHIKMWQECRRRSEAKAETVKQEWQALLRNEHEIIQKLEAQIEQAYNDGVRNGFEISEVWNDREQQMEERERKAFEAGCRSLEHAIHDDEVSNWIDQAYRAFKEGEK